MNAKELGIAYDNICLSPVRITAEMQCEAMGNVLTDNVSAQEVIRPSIDGNSGNIHPSRDAVRKSDEEQIRQLVLCSGLGPHTKKLEDNEPVYSYPVNNTGMCCKVHRACYFPLIEEDKDLHENWRYKL